MSLVMNVLGWSGVLLCTIGYLLLSIKKITADSPSFQWLNVVGGLCLTVTAVETYDLPNAAANLLWVFIGLYALVRSIKKKRSKL